MKETVFLRVTLALAKSGCRATLPGASPLASRSAKQDTGAQNGIPRTKTGYGRPKAGHRRQKRDMGSQKRDTGVCGRVKNEALGLPTAPWGQKRDAGAKK